MPDISLYINLRNRLAGHYLPDVSSCDRCLCSMSETLNWQLHHTCLMSMYIHVSGLTGNINVSQCRNLYGTCE